MARSAGGPTELGSLRRAAATAAALLRAFRGESVRLRAMALTYISLFALVPALVVAFSVLQAVSANLLWARVHEYLLDNLAVGARATIAPYLDRFVKNAHATGAGLVGGVLLLWALVSLFANVERAVNDVWSIQRQRSLTRKWLVYWAGLTLGPLLLAGSVTLGRAARDRLPAGHLTAALVGWALTSAFFAVLYLIVPATKVRLRPAAIAGGLAGLGWEIAKWAYTFAVVRFFRYHAIYGSVAAVPIFLVWLYLSWTILLWGARVAFVLQHAQALMRGHRADSTPLGREQLAAQVMLEVALAFDRGEPAPEPAEIAVRLEALGEPVREVMAALRSAALVAELAGGGHVPARSLGQITLADVRSAVAGSAAGLEGGSSAALIAGVLAEAEGAAAEALAEVSYQDLCARIGRQTGAGASKPVPERA